MRVLRNELAITDHQIISVPLGSTILSVAPGRNAGHHIDVWLTDTEAPMVPVDVYIVGTGNPMPPDLFGARAYPLRQSFIGTCVMPNGLVWHVFTGKNHDRR